MQLLRLADLNRQNQNTFNKGSIVSIGNFDGMHLGHQHILSTIKQLAKASNMLSCVICFEPQPKEFFMKQNAPKRISPFRDKMLAFKQAGIDTVLSLNFNQKLAELSAQDFIDEILLKGLNAKTVVIGDDFRFGKNREGDYTLLQQQSIKRDFTVQNTNPYLIDNQRVSSSHIRKLLTHGHFDEAQKFLGHPYALSGRIHHGQKNGRKLGFPTINIPIPVDVVVSGVYVVKVYLKGKVHFGVANIGIRPTFCGKLRLLETYIFNFDHDLYGQYVTIEFLKFIRGEKKFENFNALVAQIQSDKKTAEDWITNNITWIRS